MFKNYQRERERKKKRDRGERGGPGFLDIQHISIDRADNSTIYWLNAALEKRWKAPEIWKHFAFFFSTYHLLCLCYTNSRPGSENSSAPSRRGLIERGQGANSQPSSVDEFLSAGCPQPLRRWLQMNLPWQAYTNQTSCSRDPRRLPGAQSEGFREADPTACPEIITHACPPFSLSSPQPATPAFDLWPPL